MRKEEGFNNIKYVEKYGRSALVRLDYTRSMVNDIKIELKGCLINNPVNILDIGCGTGDLDMCLCEAFPNARICSLDSSKEMINYATKVVKNSNVEFINSSIEDYDGGSQSFDLIISQYSFEYWDYDKAIPNIIRMLKKGGMLYLRNLNPEINDEVLDNFSRNYCSDDLERDEFIDSVKKGVPAEECKKILEKYSKDEVKLLFFRSNSKYNSIEMRDLIKKTTINYNAVIKSNSI